MKKKIVTIVLVFILLWIIAMVVDCIKVESFEKPIFSRPILATDDGGSGHYQGFGYSFDIKGNFMPEDKNPGITEYTYYLFGFKVKSDVRE
ncbi:MAG: hypothetical protein GX241_06845 [Ruminococcaceae bacterium]|jgi:hypothetical protein|nr:hypothetical protein [Oscillospiraceae bacterium]